MRPRLAFLLVLVACICASAPTAGAATRGPTHYVGTVEDTRAFVALVVRGSKVVAYICDGDARTASFSIWFRGRLSRNAVKLGPTAGATLDARRSRGRFRGTLKVPDGRSFDLSAARVTRRGGLHELRTRGKDGTRIRGGWIVLRNGKVRGKITETGVALTGTSSVGSGVPGSSAGEPFLGDSCGQAQEALRQARQELGYLRQALKALDQQRPAQPPAGASDSVLEDYARRLQNWEAARAQLRREIAQQSTRVTQREAAANQICQNQAESEAPK